MADKNVIFKEEYASLNLDELTDVAGGLRLKDLTPEEKVKLHKLRAEFDKKKMSGSPASEEFRRFMDYVDELERKYDPDYNNGKY